MSRRSTVSQNTVNNSNNARIDNVIGLEEGYNQIYRDGIQRMYSTLSQTVYQLFIHQSSVKFVIHC